MPPSGSDFSDDIKPSMSWPHVPRVGDLMSGASRSAESEEDPEYRAKEKEEKEAAKGEEREPNAQGLDGVESDGQWQKRARNTDGVGGYQSDTELGFDVVNHEPSEDISDEHELDPKRRKQRGLSRFLSFFKHAVMGMQKLLVKQPAKMMQMVNEKTRELVEYISTYRHHSIVTPGNQAGIFDNKIEAQKSHAVAAVERAAGVAIAREATHHLISAAREAQHAAVEAAKHAAHAAAKPYEQKLEMAQQVAHGVVDIAKRSEVGVTFESGVTFTDRQGNALEAAEVSRSKLGTLSPHAAAVSASRSVDGQGLGR